MFQMKEQEKMPKKLLTEMEIIIYLIKIKGSAHKKMLTRQERRVGELREDLNKETENIQKKRAEEYNN